ncbi:MAG: S49 family peptidase, partial [Planctomycetes bacterium]|nr:S49 family peptidase [Planctomycetota bacterium]
IVSMGNVAGSGGYYVATLADTIYAEPATITGSIGVVGGKIITKGLFDWAGMSFHEYKRGKFADIWNTNRRYSDDERTLLWGFMERVYGDFKNRVLEGRKDRIKGELEPLAGGRVYAGAAALDIGLIDQLGGFADAIKHAADAAELGGKYEVRVFPRPKSFFDMLGEAFGGEKEEDEFTFVKLARPGVGSKYAALPPVAAGLDALRSIDPGKAKALQNFLIQMELFSDERVLMVDTSLSTLCP